MAGLNRKVVLASRPQGAVTEQNFRIVDAPMPQPADGEVLVRNEWLSLDPYMRGRMSDAKSYVPPAQLDEVMVGQTVGEVVDSRNPRVSVGDKVLTQLGWQSHGIANGADVTKVDARHVPASYYLGVLGMPGFTAWFGLFEIGQPRAGETVVVSAASGAVGSVVGQLAKIRGCRAVGIAGGTAKCDHVVHELGFDACVDHRAGNLYDDLRAACPDGIDVDFENVGGAVLDTALRLMNRHSRVVLCGLVAEYGAKEPYGYQRLRSVLVNRIRMQGMIVFDWKDRYGEALAGLTAYVAEGRLKYRESIVEGLDNAPRALIGLLKGENFGKQLVKIA
ncbi:MAG TPA: NADP-dependent oxidoreductase [Casimicrobiaceae bacterium]|nr:NADP-dependent oxidoreductase [Casimicrobiaceae bacterium]